MSSDKGEKTKKYKKGVFKNYLVYILSFLAIGLIAMVIAITVVNKPATDFVHRVEKTLSMEIRDVEIKNSYSNSKDGKDNPEYGDLMGNVTIEGCGLNCNIYYGDNRVSYRNGAGFDENTAQFGTGKVSVITGFDETYFSALEYVQEGDIVTVTVGDERYSYSVTDTEYIDTDTMAYQSENMDMLVLRSICSDFSDHGGEYLYVFAQRIDGEGN